MLDYASEGILLQRKVGNTTTPMYFYTDNNNLISDNRYIKVSECDSNLTIKLYSNGNIHTNIPCNLIRDIGPQLHNITTNISDTEQVSFIWKQSFFDYSSYCDTWALDDVSFALNHNGKSRVIYKENFDSKTGPAGWKIVNGKSSKNSIECSKTNGGCLYFDEGIRMAIRQAVTPTVKIDLISPIALPPPTAPRVLCEVENKEL